MFGPTVSTRTFQVWVVREPGNPPVVGRLDTVRPVVQVVAVEDDGPGAVHVRAVGDVDAVDLPVNAVEDRLVGADGELERGERGRAERRPARRALWVSRPGAEIRRTDGEGGEDQRAEDDDEEHERAGEPPALAEGAGPGSSRRPGVGLAELPAVRGGRRRMAGGPFLLDSACAE